MMFDDCRQGDERNSLVYWQGTWRARYETIKSSSHGICGRYDR